MKSRLELIIEDKRYPIIGSIDITLTTTSFNVDPKNAFIHNVEFNDEVLESLTLEKLDSPETQKKLSAKRAYISKFKIMVSDRDVTRISSMICDGRKCSEVISLLSNNCRLELFGCCLIEKTSDNSGTSTLLFKSDHTRIYKLDR